MNKQAEQALREIDSSIIATRATLARIDRKWRARRADGTVVVHASVTVVLSEVTK